MFCHGCSGKTSSLDYLGIYDKVRVCDGCFAKKEAGVLHLKGTSIIIIDQSSTVFDQAGSETDADLERAIQASLQDVKQQKQQKPKQKARVVSDDEDEELKKAIKASLAITPIQSQQPLQLQQPQQNKAPSLSQSQIDLINMFSTVVLKLDQNSPIDPSLTTLYNQILAIMPLLDKEIRTTQEKLSQVSEADDRVSDALRRYESELSKRMGSYYQGTQNYQVPVQPAYQPQVQYQYVPPPDFQQPVFQPAPIYHDPNYQVQQPLYDPNQMQQAYQQPVTQPQIYQDPSLQYHDPNFQSQQPVNPGFYGYQPVAKPVEEKPLIDLL